MLIAWFALTVGNLERLAALTSAMTAAGCNTRLVLAGEVAELYVTGSGKALAQAAELLRLERLSNVDVVLPAQHH